MKYINHFTLSTGHSRRSYAEEIDKAFLMKFKPIVNIWILLWMGQTTMLLPCM